MDISKAGVAGTSQTDIHNRMRKIIQECGFNYVEEYIVRGPVKANYSLDFYLPEFHIGVEADGPYHQRKSDATRDTWIKDTTGILIIRFGGEIFLDIKWKQEKDL